MGLGIVFFVLIILSLIVVGFVFAFKSTNSSKTSKEAVVSPGNYCLEENSICSEGYICDSEEGICVKDE